MTGPIVFIVSEDAPVRQSVTALVESASLRAVTFPTVQALLDAKTPESCSCLVFYARNSTLGEPAQQARLAAACAARPGILITERGDVSTAVHALKAGITDVVQKPYRDRDLLERIVKVLEVSGPV
jgi:two-component system, LuxR family, response regulator FixJ